MSRLALETDSCAPWEPPKATLLLGLEAHPTDQNAIETTQPSNQLSARLNPIKQLHPRQLTSQSATFLRSKKYLAQVGRPTKPELEPLRTCQNCQLCLPTRNWLKLVESFEKLSTLSSHRVRTKEIVTITVETPLPTGWRAWWTQEAACLRQRQRHGMPGFWSCELLQLEHFVMLPCSRK